MYVAPNISATREAVAYAARWCLDTQHSRYPFTTRMARCCPALARWARNGYTGLTWPPGRRVPPKPMIAAFLEQKLAA